MNKFSLIQFNAKSALRSVLRYKIADIDNVKCSSIYSIESVCYILLEHSGEITDNLYGVKVCIAFSSAEQILFNWAKSEILQSIEFIQLESWSQKSPNGRILIKNGVEVIRTFEHLTELYAILNYTKDSFSDGGVYQNIQQVFEHATKQINYGATVIDVGVESTNPNSKPLSCELEQDSLEMLLDGLLYLKKIYGIQISIDTYHEETIKWLMSKDIDVINDVSGRTDIKLVKELILNGKKYLAMHSLVVPAQRGINVPIYTNPVDYIYLWMKQKIEQFHANNIALSSVILDPGIGFGTLSAQSWFLLKNFKQFYNLPCELLLGHSRKSFLGHVVDKTAQALDLETAVIGVEFINKIDYLRVHDIRLLNELYCVRKQLC